MSLDWINSRRPTAEDADRDGHVRLSVDESYTLVPWQAVAEGAHWSQTQRWLDEHPKEVLLHGWINTRLPQKWDADIDGEVLVASDDDQGDVFLPWQEIEKGQTWRHGAPAGAGLPVLFTDKQQEKENTNERSFRHITGVVNAGDLALIAIGNDGTAWLQWRAGGSWLPIDDLPALPKEDNKTAEELFVPWEGNTCKGITEAQPIVDVPVPLCVRLPEGDDLDKDGNCLYGYWDKDQGSGRWIFSYQDKASEEDTHWIRCDAEALPETCYKPANVD